MSNPPAARLYQVADAMLDALVAGFAAESVTLPERQYISAGAPAADCPMLSVHVVRTYAYDGDLAAEVAVARSSHPGHALRAAELQVTLLRCVPTVDGELEPIIPTVAEEETAAAEVLADAVLVPAVLRAAAKAGDLPGCGALLMGQWLAIDNSGGLGGGAHTVFAGLEATW
jgi:hypothetical protein